MFLIFLATTSQKVRLIYAASQKFSFYFRTVRRIFFSKIDERKKWKPKNGTVSNVHKEVYLINYFPLPSNCAILYGYDVYVLFTKLILCHFLMALLAFSAGIKFILLGERDYSSAIIWLLSNPTFSSNCQLNFFLLPDFVV